MFFHIQGLVAVTISAGMSQYLNRLFNAPQRRNIKFIFTLVITTHSKDIED
jgi:hypothetical protein